MADFVDAFPDDDLMQVLGDDVVFIPKVGGRLEIKAFMHFDVERVGGDGYTVEHRTEVELLLSDLTDQVRKGDFLQHEGVTYCIDEQIFNDNDYGRFALVKYA